MKKFSLGGLTAAGILVTALVAGAAGGAIAFSAAQGSSPAAPAETTLHQVAADTDAAPVETASTPAAPSPAAAAVDEKPAPTVVVVHQAPAEPVSGESASAAADRAAAEADRASTAADRAEKATVPAVPAPAATPAPTPKPTPAPECQPGTGSQSVDRYGAGYHPAWDQTVRSCVGGKWQESTVHHPAVGTECQQRHEPCPDPDAGKPDSVMQPDTTPPAGS